MTVSNFGAKRAHFVLLSAVLLTATACNRGDRGFGFGGGAGDGVDPPIITGSDLEAAPNFAFANWETNVASVGCVEWGPTPEYGQEACEPVERFQHRVLLSGLQPGETYHYRVVSIGPNGTSFSEDMTFTALDAMPVLSDDFHFGNLLRPLWDLRDPGGQGQLQMTNEQGDGGVRLITPAGADYTIDGSEAALFLRQPSLPGNFTSVTKVFTTLDADGESTGVVFEYDERNRLRFGFDFSNGNVELVGALTKIDDTLDVDSTTVVFGAWDGVDPLFLRVNHTDDIWFADWSFDGSAWMPGVEIQHPLPPFFAGPYVASAEGSNGHSALFDYHFDDQFRIVPEDETIRTDRTAPFVYRMDTDVLSGTEVSVTWFADELTTGGLDWGLTEELEEERRIVEESAFQHTVLIDALLPSTDYFVREVAEDAAGNQSIGDTVGVITESE